MFINALPCLGIIQSYRLVWINGKFGGGKTSFAFAAAEPFLEQGYKLITNSRCVWADELKDCNLNEHGQLKAVIILDEGGLYFESSKQIQRICSYAAKMDCIFLFPSFWPPAKAAQVLKIQPLFSLKPTGIPLIIYKWQVDIGGFHDKGFFGWMHPQDIYGIYSRQDPGAEPSQIVNYLLEKTREYRRFSGHNDDELSILEEVKQEDILNDAVNSLGEIVDNFGSTLSKRKRGFR